MLLHCQLICTSSAEHLTQIYTGFGALQRKGYVQLEFVRDKNYQPGILSKPKLLVIVNERQRIVYDSADDHNIQASDVASCDFYFKRSYAPAYVETFDERQKIHSLCLNYPVYGPCDGAMHRAYWSFLTDRSLTKQKFLTQWVRTNNWLARLPVVNGGRRNCAIEKFEGLPRHTEKPVIMFYTRAWDPSRVSDRPALVEERKHINNTRAQCIRLLRQEFGNAFEGGFEPGEFARQNFADCMAPDPAVTKKRNYLTALRRASIGIATMGLEGSNGWKLAEYVAGAKAILSEKLMYQPPGDFSVGQNYLEFSTPEECVAQMRELVENHEMRYAMMRANYAYYQAHLRPDMLIWNTLQHALMSSTKEHAK